ncbi:MAG: DUF115 domain-containing protein [Anaerolineales bacterium]|nr:MAG: DUF115 domain-containing protein [Anaerolineales bacterium]
MSGLRSTLKQITPKPLRRPLSNSYWWWYNRGRHQLAAVVSVRYRESVREIREYHNCHRGQRCFILGNGPSLRNTNLSLLRNEVTFGLNRIYLLYPEMGFPTTYLVSVNDLVIMQCAEELSALSITKFITWRARKWMAKDPRIIFLDTDYTLPETFSEDISGRVYEGSTVTYVALQIAFHMGFEQVILIGVDHSFRTTGPANTIVVSDGEDMNHFHPDYFGKGFRWQLPDLEGSERAYRLARQAYESHGRQVMDATIGGKLTVFPKVEYASLFKS